MIELAEISLQAGAFSLRNLSFEVRPREYVVLMGKTGSGKTTILEAICGLRSAERARARRESGEVAQLVAAGRRGSNVTQDLALFPQMTVRGHLEFALRIRRRPPVEIAARVSELAALLGIESLLTRRPQGLSGGEAQRVALGRALSFAPQVLLLDEPLSALDEETRGEMVELLRTIRRETAVTVLHVPHRRVEAAALADRCFRLGDGRLTKG